MVLCTRCLDGVVYMLFKWCYVHVVMCACFTCGVVCMWFRVRVVHVVLSSYGVVYT